MPCSMPSICSFARKVECRRLCCKGVELTCETSIVAHADVHKGITLWNLVHISASPSYSSARTAKWTGESDDRGYWYYYTRPDCRQVPDPTQRTIRKCFTTTLDRLARTATNPGCGQINSQLVGLARTVGCMRSRSLRYTPFCSH